MSQRRQTCGLRIFCLEVYPVFVHFLPCLTNADQGLSVILATNFPILQLFQEPFEDYRWKFPKFVPNLACQLAQILL